MSKQTSRLQGLDGLRGIAILLTVACHLWSTLSGQVLLPEGSLNVFLYAGNAGVTLFFVLSGFLVSLPLFRSLNRGELYPINRYAQQRLMRILPPYYVVGLVGIVCTGREDQLFSMLLFRASAFDVGYFSTVWWSLATEIQFYLILPVFFLAALSRYRLMLLSVALILCVSAYMAVMLKVVGPEGPEGNKLRFQLILSVIGQMPAFTVGALLAGIYTHRKINPFRPFLGRALVMMLIFLLGWVLAPGARIGAIKYTYLCPWQVLPQAVIWGGVLWLLLNREIGTRSLLDNQLTRYFGKISFSLYLVHMPVLHLILPTKETHGLWLSLLATSALSVGVAQLSYLLIEHPALRLRNKLFPPRTSSGALV